MSGDSVRTSSERRTAVDQAVERFRAGTAVDVRAVGGLLAAAAVCSLTAVRVGLNAPLGSSSPDLQLAYDVASVGAVVVPGVVAVVVGIVADADWALVGLVAAGVFSLLATFAPAAGPAATGVLGVAALLVVAPTVASRRSGEWRQPVFGGLVVVAVGLSLAAATGLLGAGLRAVGTTVTLLALLAAPLAAGASHRALLAGAVTTALVVAGAVAAPFVAGAVFLAVGAAVDPNVVVAGAGVGGGVAVVAEGGYRRQGPLVAAGALLLAAGVPTTVPRALAVVLGTHLLLAVPGPSTTESSDGGASA